MNPGDRRLRFVARLAEIMGESDPDMPRREAVLKPVAAEPPTRRRSRSARMKGDAAPTSGGECLP